ncbi:MAG: NADH-quinone oxidoreductase subunit I [Deltaproteobacteria bacterium]|nr:MAG: NADH-quinone oxidoreductase subunit I [Deltaproteobacteria bacterium]
MTIFERVYVISAFKGLLITLSHLLRNMAGLRKLPIYEYPEKPKPIPEGYRGEHRLMKREDGSVRCTSCMLCATACPAECIEIVAKDIPDPAIEKQPEVYNINLLRCVFCGLCVEACPVDAIRMDTKKVDMAGFTREEFIHDINYLVNNHPEGMSPYSIAPTEHK